MSVASIGNVEAFPPRGKEAVPQYYSRETPEGRVAPLARDNSRPPLPAEIAFLTDYGTPIETLRQAAALARRQKVFADELLIAEGFIAEETFYRALADHLGAPFIDTPVDLAPEDVATAARGYASLKNSRDGKWLFSPRGAEVAQLASMARAARGQARFAVTTRSLFLDAVRRAGAVESARIAAYRAERADPQLCVRPCLNSERLGWSVLSFGVLVALLFAPWREVVLLAALPLAAVFLASVFLRLFATAASFEARMDDAWLEDARLPVYTIILALHREAAIAAQLSGALDRLDYPRAKLDIKFMIECDDHETAAALRAHPPCAPHEIIFVAEGEPRTKPRALNVALESARGPLVCVFDAEDLPEPGQLRRAAALFSRLPKDVACLQASLVIDNARLNWMTALFAIEYAALFDVFNRGLSIMGLPIFLGGTSNHFRAIM